MSLRSSHCAPSKYLTLPIADEETKSKSTSMLTQSRQPCRCPREDWISKGQVWVKGQPSLHSNFEASLSKTQYKGGKNIKSFYKGNLHINLSNYKPLKPGFGAFLKIIIFVNCKLDNLVFLILKRSVCLFFYSKLLLQLICPQSWAWSLVCRLYNSRYTLASGSSEEKG